VQQLITIELLGETFQFKVQEEDQNPGEIADYLVAEVDTISRQFPEHVKKTNKLAILVSAALNVTKKYFELKSHHLDFVSDVSHRAYKLDDMLDQR